MRYIIGPILWIYDFLAEDLTLLVGAAIAILIVILAIHVIHIPRVAGYILFAVVVLVIAASLWRSLPAEKG